MLLLAATSPETKLLMLGLIFYIYTYTHTRIDTNTYNIYTLNSVILHKSMCQLYCQRTALRTICCDAGLFIQFCVLPFKVLFSSYMLSTVSILYLLISVYHSPSLFLPISCPLATEESPFQNFQIDTFLRERRSKAYSKTETWDPTLCW